MELVSRRLASMAIASRHHLPLQNILIRPLSTFKAKSPRHIIHPAPPPPPALALANLTYTPREQKQLSTPYTKLKPSYVSQRISRLRTYVGTKKDIRGSPWKLNLVCQFAARETLTVPEALRQLDFVDKAKAPLVRDVIRKTANLADIRDGIKYHRLEVAECFATHGTHLKRISYHSKGRFGKKLRRFSHMRVVVREIDFNLKIAQAVSINQKKRWVMLKRMAIEEEMEARKEREEMEDLERQAREVLEKKKKNQKE